MNNTVRALVIKHPLGGSFITNALVMKHPAGQKNIYRGLYD